MKYLLADIVGGGTPDTENKDFWDGEVPWVSPKDMKVDFLRKTQDYVTQLAIERSSTNLVEPNTVLIVVRSGIFKHTFPVAINQVPVTLNQDMKGLVPNELIDYKYLATMLKGFEKITLTYCSKLGATVDSILYFEQIEVALAEDSRIC